LYQIELYKNVLELLSRGGPFTLRI